MPPVPRLPMPAAPWLAQASRGLLRRAGFGPVPRLPEGRRGRRAQAAGPNTHMQRSNPRSCVARQLGLRRRITARTLLHARLRVRVNCAHRRHHLLRWLPRGWCDRESPTPEPNLAPCAPSARACNLQRRSKRSAQDAHRRADNGAPPSATGVGFMVSANLVAPQRAVLQ